MQTSHLLMVRPAAFGVNPQTLESNKFQVGNIGQIEVQQKALAEFDAFVAILKNHNIDITVIEDTLEPHTPDAIFPNNWISFHQDGKVILYPMEAENRRKERRLDIIDNIKERFKVAEILDLSPAEKQNTFLEGTGSLVLDRTHHIAYACLSSRTSVGLLSVFSEKTGYEIVRFKAEDKQGNAIYHTNVMMCVAEKFAVICLEAIKDPHEQQCIVQQLQKSGKEIIAISDAQMQHFAGNMLEVKNTKGQKLLIMSETAFKALSTSQIKQLSAYAEIVHAPLNTIETNGGGSARCMLAEIDLPLK